MCTPGDGGGGPPDAMEIRDGACVSLDGAALAAPGCP
jgi:hypothetical protein